MIRRNLLLSPGERARAAPRYDWIQLRETLDEGMRLFHAGDRILAVPALDAVLESPVHVPSFRLAAASLLAETHRGQGEFKRAEQYYVFAIRESESIPIDERLRNEWYRHYRPRVQLGLIMVLRRALSGDHDRLQQLLRGTRDRFAGAGAGDVMAQLNAVEGLYLRQRGDLAGAIDRLGLAREAMNGVAPPFTFLAPDHMDALLMQVKVLTPGARALVGRAARGILRAPDAGPWSKAVAATGLLHVRLGLMAREGAGPQAFSAALDDPAADGVDGLFAALDAHAAAEGDPLVTTESITLRAAWLGAAGRTRAMHAQVDRLARCLDGVSSGTTLLRAVEAAMIVTAFAAPEKAASASLDEVRGRGLSALAELEPGLASYGEGVTPVYGEHLRQRRLAAGGRRLDWLGEPLSGLRALTWP